MDFAFTVVICKAVAVLTNRSTPMVRWYGFFINYKTVYQISVFSPLKNEIDTNILNFFSDNLSLKKCFKKIF